MFKKAVKTESKLRMAIDGPSGSGKTYTALTLATALANGHGVAVIDTERGSASKYSDLFGFDVCELGRDPKDLKPFHPEKYISAISEASGYDVLVIDSLSHAWSGKGGILECVDEIAKRAKSGNKFTAWSEGTPLQNRLIDAILAFPGHVIATMRSKTEYVTETNDRGKAAPRKVGTAPVQRDGVEYEFDIVADMTLDNEMLVSKSRCPALTGAVISKPTAAVADTLKAWMKGEKPTSIPAPVKSADLCAECNTDITGVTGSDNKTLLSESTLKRYGRKLCKECALRVFASQHQTPTPLQQPATPSNDLNCSKCSVGIDVAQADATTQKHGKPLCEECASTLDTFEGLSEEA